VCLASKPAVTPCHRIERTVLKHAGHGKRPHEHQAPDARPAARARAGDMEALAALVAAVGRAAGRARNKRGLTPLGEAVAAGRADAAELLAMQARPRLSPCILPRRAFAGGHECHRARPLRRGAPMRVGCHPCRLASSVPLLLRCSWTRCRGMGLSSAGGWGQAQLTLGYPLLSSRQCEQASAATPPPEAHDPNMGPGDAGRRGCAGPRARLVAGAPRRRAGARGRRGLAHCAGRVCHRCPLL